MSNTERDIEIAETLGSHGAKLDLLIERTQGLAVLSETVARHDTELRVIKNVTNVFGVGLVTAFVAWLRSRFSHGS